jgi:pyruvate-formate lyase-activating enzyme
MKKLRLVMFDKCNRSCEGCCNKDWDLNGLDVCDSFEHYDLIMLTGGEPMLNPKLVIETCHRIRQQTHAAIVLYTAKSKRALDILAVLSWIDGLTLTLHEPYDVEPFVELNDLMKLLPFFDSLSLRLNVFNNVDISGIETDGWEVKSGIEWIKDCPLPEDEVIQRLWC